VAPVRPSSAIPMGRLSGCGGASGLDSSSCRFFQAVFVMQATGNLPCRLRLIGVKPVFSASGIPGPKEECGGLDCSEEPTPAKFCAGAFLTRESQSLSTRAGSSQSVFHSGHWRAALAPVFAEARSPACCAGRTVGAARCFGGSRIVGTAQAPAVFIPNDSAPAVLLDRTAVEQ
jgi:hypothetical protein